MSDLTLFDGPEPLPVLPYGGTAGWSGSETSRTRDASEVTAQRQRQTLNALRAAGQHGATFRELGDMMGWHHGQSSGVLSTLHKRGLIVRLVKVRPPGRGACKVYVLPEFTADRPTEAYMPNVSARLLGSVLAELDADLAAGQVSLARRRLRATLAAIGQPEP